jgi:hypothetical protein
MPGPGIGRRCNDPAVGAADDDSFEAKLRVIAEQIGGSIERAVENLDLNEMAEQLGMSGERAKELADLAKRWLSTQIQGPVASLRDQPEADDRSSSRHGPHPLDMPTEEQGLALSALDSGRWKVDPGTEELVPIDTGPGPGQPIGLVGELRARDWIAPHGEVTLVGRDALKRWLARANPS